MKTAKRIRTVLYEDQRLSSAELEVIHTPAMQRLYGLRQLGLSDRVFIDASHSRIHHVVGVLQQVDKLVYAIIHSLRRSDRTLRIGAAKDGQQTFPASKLAIFVRKRRPVIRFIGLLHDLTHAPFGHTVEDEIRLVETKHDEPERQADAFYRLLCQLIAWLCVEAYGPDFEHFPASLKPFQSQGATATLPDVSEVGTLARSLISEMDPARAKFCWRLSCREIAEMFAHLQCAMTALLHLEALHQAKLDGSDLPKEEEYEFQAVLRIALQGTLFEPLLHEFKFQPKREAFMLDIVGNTVCADLLDYARRDSHFAGLRLDYDADRIAENFTLVGLDASAYEVSHAQSDGGSEKVGDRLPNGRSDPFEGWCLRTAISLVSHKYRTDIPSELMNLLNVRFYLYERVIFHPTKCAAGSMLGTALQLLGWRESGGGKRPSLPTHLRFVGDDVFIHDISAALDFILDWMATVSDNKLIDDAVMGQVAIVDRVHSGLVPTILGLHMGQTVSEARQELAAGRLLLDRLAARRYFRPVFRALPSSTDTRLQAGPEALAKVFRDPDARYEAERRIEAEAQLPLGTVTIHCPTRTTARKIANVLLTKRSSDGVDQVCKLKHIASLDDPIFGEHQNAVKAVEEMYRSMWRLTVYVAPEHLARHQEISQVAGRVIFKTIDVHDQFADQDLTWPNDPNLEQELAAKLAPGRQSSDDSDLSPLGELVGRISDELLESGRLAAVSSELLGPIDELSNEARTRIETALLGALASRTPSLTVKQATTDSTTRVDELIRVFKTYTKKPKREDIADFKRSYLVPLNTLSPENFSGVVADLEAAIQETHALDGQGSTAVHRGYKFSTLVEVLDELLRKYADSSGSKVRDDLFGDQK
jgi:HD superfamily phosphohydrolase